jgi:hypothetical protein
LPKRAIKLKSHAPDVSRFRLLSPPRILLVESMSSESPFKPLKSYNLPHSTNPKTILNRKYQSEKRGLDIALHRLDTNFRVKKSRALKKLASSPEWESLNEAERKLRQDEVVAPLADKRQQETERLEREWFQKVETNDIDDDEEDLPDAGEEVEDSASGDRMRDEDEEEDEWEDEDEGEWMGLEKEEEEQNVEAGVRKLKADIRRSVMSIKTHSGREWTEKMELLERGAIAKWKGVDDE